MGIATEHMYLESKKAVGSDMLSEPKMEDKMAKAWAL